MNFAAARLTFRLHGFGSAGIGLLTLSVAALAVWYATRIDSLPDAVSCGALAISANPDESAVVSCRAFAVLNEEASRVAGIMAFLPILAGLFLGVPIVAQELDRGTAPLAWWLDPSRSRWLLQRAMPVAFLAVLLGLIAGAAIDHLESRLLIGVDPAASFHNYGLRGPIVAARVLLFLGCGVLVGSLLGRTLPSMLVALLVGAVLLGGISHVQLQLQRAEAVPLVTEDGYVRPADRAIAAGARLPSGEELTYDELRKRYPNPGELLRAQETSTFLTWVVPGDQYALTSGREAAATVGLGLLLLMAAMLVVTRRRTDPGRVRVGIPAFRRRSGAPRTGRTSGSIAAIRLTLWPHRSEIAAGLAVGLVSSVGGVLLLAVLAGLSAPAHCIQDRFLVPAPADCTTTEQFVNLTNEWGGRLFALMAVLPWLVGALVGVVIVGREIEHRTAILAWSLAPDRRRWLLGRVAVAGVLVVLLLAIPSVVATEVERVVYPWAPPELSFNDYALRGPLVVARGVGALGIGLLAGAVVGRILPSLLVAGAGCALLAMVLGLLLPFGQPADALRTPGYSAEGSQPLIGYSISGERLREVELREMVFIGGVVLVLVAATTVVTERRRPY